MQVILLEHIVVLSICKNTTLVLAHVGSPWCHVSTLVKASTSKIQQQNNHTMNKIQRLFTRLSPKANCGVLGRLTILQTLAAQI
jgi:hypothetical protein